MTSWPWVSLRDLLDDLLDQLAGRRQDDGLGAFAAGFEHFNQGDGESGRLAGSRLGLTNHIVAGKGFGNEFGLDRRRG